MVAVLGAGSLLAAPAAAQDAEQEGETALPERPASIEREEGTTVVAVRVEGERRFTEEQIREAFGHPIGEPLDRERLSRGIDELWDVFRVRAVVSAREVEGGIELLLEVDEIPVDLEPRFVGNVDVDTEELLDWADLRPGSELYLHQTSQVRRRIVDEYRRKGYYFADVRIVTRDLEVAEAGFGHDVIFEIQEGPRVKVRNVVVHGNRSLPEKGFLFWKSGLRHYAQVQLKETWLPFWKKDFDEEVMRADLLAMRQVYRDRGWLDAVVELDRLEFTPERTGVTIHVVIDEGEPYTVAGLSIEGVELEGSGEEGLRPEELILPQDRLLAECSLEVGERYDRGTVNADERALRDLYGEHGHVAHPSLPRRDRWQFLEPSLLFDVERKEVHVTYRIAQGRQQFIREVRFVGALHTKDRVLRRLVSVYPGELADLDEIGRSLNRIRRTNFFSDRFRPLQHPEPTYRFVETHDPSYKDLEFVVEEGSVLRFDIAGGVGSNVGAFGVLSLGLENFDATNLPTSPWPWDWVTQIARKEAFHGAGQRVQIRIAPGTEESQYNVSFYEPDVFRTHQPAYDFTAFANRRTRIYDSHDEDRREVGFRIGRELTLDSSVFLRYRIGEIEVDDLDESGEPSLGNPLAVPQLLKEQEGHNDLSYLEVGYALNTLDSNIFPREGWRFGTSASVSSEELGSDFDFVSFDSSVENYGLFGEEVDGPRHGYHASLRGGVAVPYGDTDDVPYSERFFLGGRTTLRGFDLRGVGPVENGFPIGGESYLAGTVEYRFPIFSSTPSGGGTPIEAVRGALFLDAGVLDPEPFSLDLDEVRASVGFAFGLTHPIPLAFSFGFPIESQSGDDERVFNFAIGL